MDPLADALLAPEPVRTSALPTVTRAEAEQLVRVADRRAGLDHVSPATPDRLRAAVGADRHRRQLVAGF